MEKKSKGKGVMRDFISEESRIYKMRIGSTIASSLAGVVCGVIMASIIWFVALRYFIDVVGRIYSN